MRGKDATVYGAHISQSSRVLATIQVEITNECLPAGRRSPLISFPSRDAEGNFLGKAGTIIIG
jgi:hypothetical protein